MGVGRRASVPTTPQRALGMLDTPGPLLFACVFPARRGVKQLLLERGYSDIAQKHRASKFIFTTGRVPSGNLMMKERLK